MDENQNKNEEIEKLKRYISAAEESLEQAKKALQEVTGENLYKSPSNRMPEGKVVEAGKIIEGLFDGENMVGPEGKKYPVPANYSSKSKLVEGDRLKLTVADDGSFIFKQIGPIERKKLVGTLSLDDNVYHVLAEGKSYRLLFASVSYHKAQPGDRVTIVVPAVGEPVWAALENIIHDTPKPVEAEPEEIFDIPEATPQPLQQSEVTIPVSAVAPAPSVETSPYIAEVPTAPASQPQVTTETALPEESFLPRTPSETANNLGEAQVGQQEALRATELDI